MKVIIRSQQPTDHSFIYATYLRNRWFDKANTTTLKRATWSSLQHNRIENILNDQLVLIACLDEDQDTILGYAFMDGSEEFAYVKLSFRSGGFKVKERLLEELKHVG